MTLLEFTFQSFWHFNGMIILIWAICAGLVMVAAAVRGVMTAETPAVGRPTEYQSVLKAV